jgi:hypothetical protein
MERQKKGKIIEALKYENIFEAKKNIERPERLIMIISMKCILFFFRKATESSNSIYS